MLSRATSHPQPSPIFNGTSVDLVCEATSGDLNPISYSWTDPNGQSLSPDTDGRISFTLTVYGTYTCTATNQFGVDRSTVELLIEAGNYSHRSVAPFPQLNWAKLIF